MRKCFHSCYILVQGPHYLCHFQGGREGQWPYGNNSLCDHVMYHLVQRQLLCCWLVLNRPHSPSVHPWGPFLSLVRTRLDVRHLQSWGGLSWVNVSCGNLSFSNLPWAGSSSTCMSQVSVRVSVLSISINVCVKVSGRVSNIGQCLYKCPVSE